MHNTPSSATRTAGKNDLLSVSESRSFSFYLKTVADTLEAFRLAFCQHKRTAPLNLGLQPVLPGDRRQTRRPAVGDIMLFDAVVFHYELTDDF